MKPGVWIASVLALLSGLAGWVVTDRLEANNEFCVACHLETDTLLHETKMDEFLAQPAVNLAALHAASEDGFLCIDCHGGASFVNKALVKTVAARDLLMYVIGRFGEPDSMEHPLWDEDCSRCHASFEALRPDDYHAIELHNLPGFEFRCVSCHLAHATGGSVDFGFLEQSHVLSVCRNCHEEY